MSSERIFERMFERIMNNNVYELFTENKLVSPNQSGFKPGDSCINHLLPITYEIYKSFNDGAEVRGVFLDISNVFDKVWYKGLLYKLKQNGISNFKLISSPIF